MICSRKTSPESLNKPTLSGGIVQAPAPFDVFYGIALCNDVMVPCVSNSRTKQN